MKPKNTLYIMSDEHNPTMMGCYGHEIVQTPNIDKLAARGTRFTAHYTNSPICIPARAAFATGRYTHETKYWDNATAYDGAVKGWGHRLQEEGISVESIGKLHYRNEELPTGFSKQYLPMHVMDGIGQVWGSIRDPLPKERPSKMLNKIGPGTSNYNRYDMQIADQACSWLKDAAEQKTKKPDIEKPWVLYVGFVAPHFPFVVPEQFYNLYPLRDLPPRKLDPETGYQRHPWIQRMDDFQQTDRNLTPEQRLQCVAAYYGLCTFVDFQIGRVLEALDETGLTSDTRIIYTSDHGENLGARGMWGKSNMYEESARIPLIISGEGIPEGRVCSTTTSLLDSYQTILQGTGIPLTDEELDLEGASWLDLANQPDDPERIVFSEYHASASPTGAFMIRKGKYKYIHYVDYKSELFDLEEDPEESTNLADNPKFAGILIQYRKFLFDICDPEKTDRAAKDDQNTLIEKFGGREKALHIGTPGATPAPGQAHES